MQISDKLKKRAISELFATLMMIVVTLIAGAAVLGWVNGQAGVSEKAYGNSAANNINYLNERFAIESQVFSSATGSACSGTGGPGNGCTSARFYIYNDGALTFTLYSIQVESTSQTYPLNVVFYTSCTASTSCSNPTGAYREAVTQPSGCSPGFSATGGTSSNPPTGFYLVSPTNSTTYVPNPLPQGYLSTTFGTRVYGPYWITLPSCSGQLYMYDTIAYTVILTGLYGNVVQETITANG